jgi:putative transposase
LRRGHSSKERELAYCELFQEELNIGLINEIRQSTNGNYALGSERCKDEVSKVLGHRVTLGKSGRPQKNKALDK